MTLLKGNAGMKYDALWMLVAGLLLFCFALYQLNSGKGRLAMLPFVVIGGMLGAILLIGSLALFAFAAFTAL